MTLKSVIRPVGSIVLYILLTVLFPVSICRGQDKNERMKIYPYAYPLKVSAGNRYLIDQSNQPFFWSGDAAWSLIAQLSTGDADLYLENRKDKGFTVIMVSLIEHKFCTNAPANFYGELPFKGSPFITTNERYFAHADSVIESAWQHNILVLLAPLYLGYDCKDEGWCAEVKNSSSADLLSWGRYVGERYKKFNNIIWLIGGDTDPSPVKDKVMEMVKGIRENDTIHLFSAHNQPESMAADPWSGESWLKVNNVYSYDSVIYKHYMKAYKLVPAIPYYQIESAYENEHNSTPQQLRSHAYWAILSGAMGHVFGNCPVWHFGSATTWCKTNDWKTELNNAGSVSMDYLQRLFRSRSWQKLVPDFENRLVTSGYGSWGTKNHVSSASTDDGSTIIAYLPSKRTVTADMRKVHGVQARCWWYNPSDGSPKEIGVFPVSGSHKFTPPTDGDWLLVIDNAAAKLSAPGSKALINAIKIRK
jgi:hypothetical protein